MDAGTVKTFCDTAVQLLPVIAAYAALEADQRTPEDEAQIRALRVAAGALAHALVEVPRQQPPMPPAPPRPPDVHAATAPAGSPPRKA